MRYTRVHVSQRFEASLSFGHLIVLIRNIPSLVHIGSMNLILVWYIPAEGKSTKSNIFSDPMPRLNTGIVQLFSTTELFGL